LDYVAEEGEYQILEEVVLFLLVVETLDALEQLEPGPGKVVTYVYSRLLGPLPLSTLYMCKKQ
jgi:hypothetical protein